MIMKTIAVFGGTFNPVHIGHEQMIGFLCKLDFLDKILVMPAKIPPHKEVDFLARDEDRINMLQLACDKTQKASVCDLELKRAGKSYTVDTLSELQKLYCDTKIFLCIGGDMLTSFKSWYRYDEILKMSALLVFKRSTDDALIFEKCVNDLKSEGADITVLPINIADVSSTEIREAFCLGKSPSNLLSDEVLGYIIDNKIYGDKD